MDHCGMTYQFTAMLSLSPEAWISIALGSAVSFGIAYFIYFKQKHEAVAQQQNHDARFDELKTLHQEDSEKIRVLYELIIHIPDRIHIAGKPDRTGGGGDHRPGFQSGSGAEGDRGEGSGQGFRHAGPDYQTGA